MPGYEEIEKTLNQVAQDLSELRAQQEEQKALIDKVFEDRFPHTPLVQLYKRPPYAPCDC